MKKLNKTKPSGQAGLSVKAGKKAKAQLIDQAPQLPVGKAIQPQPLRPKSIEAVHRFGKTSGST